MTFGPIVLKHGLNKRNFGQCVTYKFLKLFGQNFKISQKVNSVVTLQENKFKCNIMLVIIET
jgi:prophage maintenance system killer protein